MSSERKKHQLDNKSIGKEDINFPEFPLGVFNSRGKVESNNMTFYDSVGGRDIEINIRSSAFGFPTQGTRDLYRALLRIHYKKNKFQTDNLKISAGEILRELGRKKCGRSIKALEKDLEILSGTKITFKNSYFDKLENRHINTTLNMGIITGFKIRSASKTNLKGVDPNYFDSSITWDPDFYKISLLNSRNLMNFDYVYYIGLKKDISKELYLFLVKRAYSKQFLKIEINKLAFDKLGISRNLENKRYKIRQLLKNAHEELLESGFLTKEPYFEKESNSSIEYVCYFLNSTKNLSTQSDEIDVENPMINEDDRFLRNSLQEIGFAEGEIAKLTSKYSFTEISKALDLLKISDSENQIRNKKSWLFSCLKNNYDMSKVDLLKQIEQEEKTKFENKKNQELKRKEAEELKQKLEAEKNLKIQNFIDENPEIYIDLCKKEIKSLEEKENASYYILLKKSKESDQSILEVFMKGFDKKIRNYILENLINIGSEYE